MPHAFMKPVTGNGFAPEWIATTEIHVRAHKGCKQGARESPMIQHLLLDEPLGAKQEEW